LTPSCPTNPSSWNSFYKSTKFNLKKKIQFYLKKCLKLIWKILKFNFEIYFKIYWNFLNLF
jgi:hypothetical protein